MVYAVEVDVVQEIIHRIPHKGQMMLMIAERQVVLNLNVKHVKILDMVMVINVIQLMLGKIAEMINLYVVYLVNALFVNLIAANNFQDVKKVYV